MKRNIVRRIAQTRLGYLLWSSTQGTRLGGGLKLFSELLRVAEERIVAARPKNRRHDAAQRAALDAFEQETELLRRP